jgi:hypothetical protein
MKITPNHITKLYTVHLSNNNRPYCDWLHQGHLGTAGLCWTNDEQMTFEMHASINRKVGEYAREIVFVFYAQL